MAKRPSRGVVARTGPSPGWHLSRVGQPEPGASPGTVGVFTATHDDGWQVVGELERQDGRLIMRSFTVRPVRLAWQATLEAIAQSRGEPGRTAVSIHTDDPTNAETPRGGVTADLVRKIPFGALLSDVLTEVAGWERHFRDLEDDGSPIEDWETGRLAKRQAAATLPLTHKSGRRPYGDDFYREVALECLAIQAERLDENVIVTLARRRNQAYETARGWVREARSPRRQMLAPGSKGRSGFEAGPRLYESGEEGSSR